MVDKYVAERFSHFGHLNSEQDASSCRNGVSGLPADVRHFSGIMPLDRYSYFAPAVLAFVPPRNNAASARCVGLHQARHTFGFEFLIRLTFKAPQ